MSDTDRNWTIADSIRDMERVQAARDQARIDAGELELRP